MENIFDKLSVWDEKIKIQNPVTGAAVSFSNTSTPSKWFVLTLEQIVSALEDLKTNINDFKNRNASEYVEGTWRDLFAEHMSDDVINTLSTVQTLPLFTLLSGIIHFANEEGEYEYKNILLDEQKIQNAIDYTRKFVAYSIANYNQSIVVSSSEKLNVERIKGGHNTIYYGAPGTGKSYSVDKEATVTGTGSLVRTVFHADTQNSDFIGSLKPAISDNGDITYRFSPGPFAIALLNAYQNPTDMHWLVIEELNRAPAAAVFGELFLLLDRNGDGSGIYDADFPSEEFAKWWHEKTGESRSRMRLPSNLSILATMNSADQGVFPLDTAFRRRWKQIYVPIKYAHAPEGNVSLVLVDGSKDQITWKNFAATLNRFLVDEIGGGISEDRLVGHRFLSEHDLEENADGIPGKLLIYLWDDLLCHHGRDILFNNKTRTYGDLSRQAATGKQIFSDNFLNKFPGTNTDGQ